MLIDARGGLRLGVSEGGAVVAVPTPKPAPGTAFAARRLTFRGTPTFELNLWCGTCPALFKKLTEPDVADLGLATQNLNSGLDDINDDVLGVYGNVLPASEYTALLLQVTPHLVEPGSAADYFTHEQVTTWGLDDSGAAEDPGTPYYRTFEASIGKGHLYEFLVPMVPPSWNTPGRVDEYAVGESLGTAVAYSILDVIQPAVDDGEDYYEHWVLNHFLLDGHHKVEAAARSGRPIRLLSLVDKGVSIAAPDDFAKLIRARSQPRQTRRAAT